jgi:hypothetical protein
MNVLEYEMLEILKRLKNDYGVIEIKAEYENEGSRQEELIRLKDVTARAGLPIILKIGGVEAVTDMYNAITLGVSGIVAPMAETRFAVDKFLHAIETFIPEDNAADIEFAINIETITAYDNIDDIFESDYLHHLSSVTVGRVDFTGSLGKDRSFADSDAMLDYCREIFSKARAKGLRCALGGAVSGQSHLFIRSLVDEGLIDKYETRKVVYHKEGLKTYAKGLEEGIRFELAWLKSKRRYYHRIKQEDEKRIEMLEKRVRAFQ